MAAFGTGISPFEPAPVIAAPRAAVRAPPPLPDACRTAGAQPLDDNRGRDDQLEHHRESRDEQRKSPRTPRHGQRIRGSWSTCPAVTGRHPTAASHPGDAQQPRFVLRNATGFGPVFACANAHDRSRRLAALTAHRPAPLTPTRRQRAVAADARGRARGVEAQRPRHERRFNRDGRRSPPPRPRLHRRPGAHLQIAPIHPEPPCGCDRPAR